MDDGRMERMERAERMRMKRRSRREHPPMPPPEREAVMRALLGDTPMSKFIEAVKRVRRVNKKLSSFEQGFISEGGIKDREWYKHLGVAPGKWLGTCSLSSCHNFLVPADIWLSCL